MTRFLQSIPTLCLFVVVSLSHDLTTAATRVELVVDELRADRTVPWPITTGVPFARGALTAANQCRLVDDQGREHPLQTKVAATWDAARSSIRWLTIDFIAQPGRKYALEFGPNITPMTFEQQFSLIKWPTSLIHTGPLQVVFSESGPSALQSISTDLDGDGIIKAEEQVAGGTAEGDHLFIAQNQVSSSARDGEDREIVVETNGPVRTCVRVDGWYTGPKGERTVRYRTRYHLFAGLSLIKVVDEFRIVGSTQEVKFQNVALPLDLQIGNGKTHVSAAIDEATKPNTFELAGAAEAVSLRQETFRHYGNLECRACLESLPSSKTREPIVGERAGPWMQVRGERAVVTGSLRWFWQQFPKEWEARPNRLTLHLWGPHAKPLDFGEAGLREFFGPAGEKYLLDWKSGSGSTPITDFFYYAGRHALKRDGADGLGINKHHEVWYHFGPAEKAKEGQEYGELADAQPLCLATGAYNVGTDVFGPLAARPNESPYEAIVDRIFDLERYAQDTFGDYGWWLFGAGPHYSYQWDAEAKRHYADPRRFEYHTYQRETQLWWNYFRSGERKFYDWAIPSENHWVDVAVSHMPTKYSTEWRGGTAGEAKLHYPKGDWSIDSPLHYVRHHDTGEAWLRSASQYWGTYHRTLETTTLAYYLTGDERYNDVVNYWKEYWSPLAGVRSDTQDGGEPWHRDQMWWQPTKPGEPSKSWAEMIRDYAPFQSGSRHQQTLFFSLSTLYEHTWDPTVKKVLDEYAAAFLDPDAKNGVWQCQDHRLPANADSPMLAHYWSPALWKYARATGDPRMPGILKKYFTACIEADPYGGDVGIYSNNQIAWGWHFTKDPRFLVAAQHELDELLPNAAPLEKPEDLGRRIYNPYAPIKSLAAVPRLIGILEEAKRAGIKPAQTPPLAPQPAIFAIRRRLDAELWATFWGWDREPVIVDQSGRNVATSKAPSTHRSHRVPAEGPLRDYRVFENKTSLTLATDWCYVAPHLETGLVQLEGNKGGIWCWGAEPIRIEVRRPWFWRRSLGVNELVIESATPALLQVQYDKRPLPVKIVKNRLTVALTDLPNEATLSINVGGERSAWFRLAEMEPRANWVTNFAPLDETAPTVPPVSLLASRKQVEFDTTQTFVPGKFGQGLLLTAGRELHIPDEITTADGGVRRLSDQRQGAMEFWIRRLWDDRTSPGPASLQILNAGSLLANCPTPNLKFDEWTHVAIVWRPMPDGSAKSLVHAYFDGVDYAFYRSLYWEGYSSKPAMFDPAKVWLKEFVTKAGPGASFVLDDVRISTEPRYVNLKLDFGRQQTFNPDAFTPPEKPAELDAATVLLLPLDGDLHGQSLNKQSLEATLTIKKQ